jgi:hypothetical protein
MRHKRHFEQGRDMRFNPIMSLGLGEWQPIEASCRSPCLNPLTTSKMKISVTNVKYDMTMNNSQKHQIWNCSEGNLAMSPIQ